MMNISEKILAIDWHDYDTAYGNAAEDRITEQLKEENTLE